jgi:hypothetical protein
MTKYAIGYERGFAMGFHGRPMWDGTAYSLPPRCPILVPGCGKFGEERQGERDGYLAGQAASHS